MAWIETIDADAAEGVLADLYAHVRDPLSGAVDDILAVHALHPAGLKAHFALYSAAMGATRGLAKAEREMIALLVSSLNGCRYCVSHHRRGLRRLLSDDALAAAIEADYASASLDARRLAMLRYVEKLTLRPAEVVHDDVRALRSAGFDDADVLGIAECAAYYAYVNRIAAGLGVEPEG